MTFKSGITYTHTWAGDSNLVGLFTVIKRTAKSIWIQNAKDTNPKTIRRLIQYDYDGVEMVYPHGVYSMAPVLRANKKVGQL